MIEVLYTSVASMPSTEPVFTREDHRLKELSLPRGQQRIPRRSQTYEDYKLPESSVTAIFNIFEQLRFVEESSGRSAAPAVEQPELQTKAVLRRRPPLGPPRRSYSATDKEPIPKTSTGLTLLDLPAELHFAILDFLDPIDSTCLGLTNKHFYSIHRRMRGKVPLSTRREGPNELEWAWHLAGNVVRPPSTEDKDKNALAKLRVRGQGYCRKCGVTRCELQKHIQTWMGDGAEYCSIKQKFGQAAPAGAKPYCYMSKPGDPERCGRHWIRKSKVVLQ
ncbi:hypothetical protein QBC47DRAFT_87630 [Echria macrotheca]|uniref:F-box domain-containing protein n=1 Tax=Echria macrotheca TaxID=438768 RepID=A0AAJ0B4U8_9PEZI|nr:hypothetical protein QBC47DRAFT_87630 [Echria macrotheca]